MLNITVNSPHFVGHTCEITPLPATMDDPSQKILKQWKNINLLNSKSNSLLTQGIVHVHTISNIVHVIECT